MSSSRRTYDTDKIIVRTITAYDDASKPIPALRTLTAGGDGTTFWAIPSSLGGFPAYNNVIVNNTALVADLSYNTLTINSVQGIGINVAGKELTFFNKGFTEFDISGGNTLVGYSNQTVTPTVKFVGTNGIRLSSDPLTNTFYIQGTTAAISSGVYAYAQLNVISNASTLTTEAIGNSNNTYLTATSVSTVLNVIGVGDIQLATNTTSNAYFISISSFTSEGYLALSSLAYNIYGSTMSTVSSLFYDIPMTGIATSSLLGFTSNVSTGIHQQFIYDQQNVMLNYTPIGKYNALSNIVIIGFPSTVAGLGSAQYVSTPSLTSTVAGLGTAGYVSTASLVSTVDSIIRTGINNIIASTVTGLGSSDYISTASLVSSVKGLGVAGYVSTASLLSTVAGMGTAGYMSTVSLVSTVAGLGAAGYLSTASLVSTVTGLNEFISSFIDPTELTSTVVGLATNTFVSTTGVTSTVAGLGSSGYVSSVTLTSTVEGLGSAGYISSFSSSPYINTQQFIASSIGVNCNAPRYPLDVNGKVNMTGNPSDNYWLLFGSSTNSNTIARSYDGLTWSCIGAATGAFTTRARAGLWDGTKWFVVGDGGGGSSQSTIKYSYDAINWSNVTSGAFANTPTQIAYNNNMYLALAIANASDSNTMKYSYDGLNWSNCVFADSPFFNNASSAAWNGSMWVVKGIDNNTAIPTSNFTTSTIKYSYDGITWSNILSGGFPNNLPNSNAEVAWNGNLWVCVSQSSSGRNGTLQYSYDGKNWNSNIGTSLTGFTTAGNSVAWNGSMWVAAGDTGIRYSYDGIIWTIVSGTSDTVVQYSVVWNGFQWLVRGSSSIFSSSDGVNWTSNALSRPSLGRLAYRSNVSPDLLVNNVGIYSQNMPNFLTTSTHKIIAFNSTLNFDNILYLNTSNNNVGINNPVPQATLDVNGNVNITSTLFSLTGNFSSINARTISTARFMASSIGVNCNSPITTLDVNGQVNVSGNPAQSYWLAFGTSTNSNTIARSYDGLTWSTIGAATGAFRTSARTGIWDGTKWLAGGPGGGSGGTNRQSTIKYSYNAINWSNATSGAFSNTTLGIDFNKTMYVAVGRDTSGIHSGSAVTIKYSYDSLNWSNATNTFDNTGTGVKWNGYMWVANGIDTTLANTLKYSYDGINWSNSLSGGFSQTTTPSRAVWNGSLWVVTGVSYDIGVATIQYSKDGIYWNNAVSGAFSYDSGGVRSAAGLEWNGSMWVVGGVDDICPLRYSYDGSNWSNTDFLSNDAITNVVWNGSLWIANSSEIYLTSINGINWTSITATLFNNNITSGISYTNTIIPDITTCNLNFYTQNQPTYLTSSHQILTTASNLILDNTLYINKNANNIGILNPNPQYNLDVNGTANISTLFTNTTSSLAGNFSSINSGIINTSRLYASVDVNTEFVSTSGLTAKYAGINCNAAQSNLYNLDINGNMNVSGYYSSKLMVALGDYTGGNFKYSYDGMNWSNCVSLGTQFAVGTYLGFVAWNGSSWLGGGEGISGLGGLQFSIDGIQWQDVGIAGYIWYCATWIAPNWIIGASGTGDGNTMFSMDENYNITPIGAVLPYDCYGIAWNGQYAIAVGDNADSLGGIRSSSDGITWSPITSGGFTMTNRSGYGVAWNGFMWVIVGSGGPLNSIRYSTDRDGANWITCTGGFSIGYGVAWNGLMWVAVGQGNSGIKYSYNGINWSNAASGGFSTGRSISWNGSMWIAVGTSASAAEGSIQYSTDGINWVDSSSGGFDSQIGFGVAYNEPFVADINTSTMSLYLNNNQPSFTDVKHKIVAYEPLLSIDDTLFINKYTNNIGIKNTNPQYTLDVNGTINAATNIYVNGLPVLTSGGGGGSVTGANLASTVAGLGTASYISTLSLTSTLEGLGSSGYVSSFSNVPYINAQQFVASLIGVNCNAPIATLDVNGQVNVSGKANKSLWLAVGDSDGGIDLGTFLTSSNGIDWQTGISIGFPIYCIAWNGSIWVAGGANGSLSYSYNQEDWTTNGNILDESCYGVAWNGNYFVAVGGNMAGGTVNSIVYGDGSNWSNITSGQFNNYGKGVAWNGSMWVAVGDNGGASGSIKYSYNGTTWSNATGGFSVGGSNVAWNGSMWVAVGDGGGNNIKYSYNGINWSNTGSTNPDSYASCVAWNGYMWVVGGNDTVAFNTLYSYNGINWNVSPTGSLAISIDSVAWNGNMWVLVGNSYAPFSNISYSYDGISWTNANPTQFYGVGKAVAYSISYTPDFQTNNFRIFSQNQPNYALTSTHRIVTTAVDVNLNNLLYVNVSTSRVGIRNANPQYTLDVTGVINTNSTIRAFGGVLSNGTFLTSDSNVKENISSADLSICYSNTKNLPLHRFNFISTLAESKIDKGQIGFIAQEVSTIFPKSLIQMYEESVSSSVYQMNYDQIFLSHYGATQLLMSTVEGQQAQINEMSNLLARVAAQVFSQ